MFSKAHTSSELLVNVNMDCSICLDQIGETNCCTTSCNHRFHLSCFQKWKGGCPLCRSTTENTKRIRTCSVCGVSGHDRRTCEYYEFSNENLRQVIRDGTQVPTVDYSDIFAAADAAGDRRVTEEQLEAYRDFLVDDSDDDVPLPAMVIDLTVDA